MEIIETILWIAIGVALAVPITQAVCMRGERRRTDFLKDIYIQECLNSVDTLVSQQLSDREQQFEYQLGIHLEEERMKEHDA
jgi:hypothetical protein